MKWAIREAVDVYFKAKSVFQLGARTIRAGEPVLIFDTVKTSTLEVGSEVSYVTGGRGNSRILSYEGDKTLTFNFEEALLSAEGLAILAGADLIPARNAHLPGAAATARSVVSHYTEKFAVSTANISDAYEGAEPNHRNLFPKDGAIVDGGNQTPRGGLDNVWLTRKPYVGQNGSIYVMLLDDAGEISGAPVEVNLKTDGENHMTQAQIVQAKAAMDAAKTAYDNDAAAGTGTDTAYKNAVEAAKTGATTFIAARDVYVSSAHSAADGTAFKTAAAAFDGLIATDLVGAIDDYIGIAGGARPIYQKNAEKYNYLRTLVEYLTEAVALLTTYGADTADITAVQTLLDADEAARDASFTAMNTARNTMANAKADYDTKRKIYMEGNAGTQMIYLRKFKAGDNFVAFDASGNPISTADEPDPVTRDEMAIFDDKVEYYVDYASALANWITGWGDIAGYQRTIPAGAGYGSFWGDPGAAKTPYTYLLQPSGGVAQPKCFKEGNAFVYKVNMPSVLYQDIVLTDYYVEYRHNATQVSILPDKFAPFMYVEGSSLVRRASDGMDLPVEFVIPKFKITTQLSFTLQSTGDPSTFNFQGDAYPDFSKFDLSRKVLADIQILDADDNYDGAAGNTGSDPTSYRRYKYNDDIDGDYLWKDTALEGHANIDYSDAYYQAEKGGPASVNEDSLDNGLIFHE